jgi:hypothetical protein
MSFTYRQDNRPKTTKYEDMQIGRLTADATHGIQMEQSHRSQFSVTASSDAQIHCCAFPAECFEETEVLSTSISIQATENGDRC